MKSTKDYKVKVKTSLSKQIKKGKELLKSEYDLSLSEFIKKFTLWADFTTEMLKQHFDKEITDEFEIRVYPLVIAVGEDEDYDDYFDRIDGGLTSLESIRNRLDFLIKDKIIEKAKKTYSKKIFIVHGHDNLLKEQVARFIKELKLIPIILHEQPSKGMTIIEKFEENSDVDYAVILLTPDDLGGKNSGDGEMNLLFPRARQNVIFELGFFIGKLGRERVCALKKDAEYEKLEMLSDFSGVIYISVDEKDWNVKLIKEMKSVGIPLDTDDFFGGK